MPPDEGAPIVQVTCNGSAFQRWDFVDHDDHIFQIRNAVTLKCMDVLGLNNNGNPVVQWTCGRNSDERFQASRGLPDFVTLKSRAARTSTHCPDVPGGLATEGAAMQVWVCDGTPAQAFGVSRLTAGDPAGLPVRLSQPVSRHRSMYWPDPAATKAEVHDNLITQINRHRTTTAVELPFMITGTGVYPDARQTLL